MNRTLVVSAGIAITMALTALWHGPLGAGDRVAAQIQDSARRQLDRDEMTQVTVQVQRSPLTRRVILRGPADDFQRTEIIQRMEALPGIDDAQWDPSSLPAEQRR